MARRVESSAEPELVCVSASHGIDTPCRTLPSQLHPGELLASKNHAYTMFASSTSHRIFYFGHLGNLDEYLLKRKKRLRKEK
jgi:hypothetical protein